MPRANRYYQAGYVWHITHRCHQREFLLKFSRDRRRWLYWLLEAKKCFNMVRAGAVSQAEQWPESGYGELHSSRQRYRIVDNNKLMALLEIPDQEQVRQTRAQWLEAEITNKAFRREARWSDSLAVGSGRFVAGFKAKQGVKAMYRSISSDARDGCEIRECRPSYSPVFGPEMGPLRA